MVYFIILVHAAPKKSPSSPSISRAIEKLLSVKELANLRAGYINSLRLYLHQFARGRLSRSVDQFTPADIERWFSGRNEAPTSRASNLGRLSSLFAFCARRGWICENICDRVEKTRLDPKPPKILTLDESRRLIDHVARREKNLLAYVALGLFAGVRPGELEKLEWEAIDLDRGRLRIDASITKVRRMRWVILPQNCLAWLKRCRRRRGKIVPAKSTRRRAIRRLRKFMGWKAWPQDILRHTAASYLVADREDVAAIARMAAKWLNKTGISAEYRDEVAVVTALILIIKHDRKTDARFEEFLAEIRSEKEKGSKGEKEKAA